MESYLKEANSDTTEIFTIPHNLEAEQSVLGALLLNNNSYERVSDYLRAEHFSHKIHGQIYHAIVTLVDAGKIADPITLKAFFSDSKELDSVGGAGYLVDLTHNVISIVSIKDYGQMIYDLYLRRELITIGEDIVLDARKSVLDEDAMTQIENSENFR